ncbi:POU domain, class 6, transcription factor 1-like isoform X2 [Limulus polyphemus]|uniref:POU domain protein n=1 Tax=Limulus polyphemus TaxID=6850 RepID=A0ABM1BL09_LIMPO|nr:POU domain, class 6, transcription factor 1-like isoform X2 [Limulus polyphemus]
MEVFNGKHVSTVDGITMRLPPNGEPSLANGMFEALKLKAEPQHHHDGIEYNHSVPTVSVTPNLTTGLPAGMFTMGTPTSIAEQLLVAVQNMNGATSADSNEASKGESSASALLAAKLGSSGIGIPGSTATINPTFGGSPLRGVVGLTGLPQMVPFGGMSGLTGFNIVNQLVSAAQGLQATVSASPTTTLANNGVSTVMTSATPASVSAAVSGQHNVQQLSQVANPGLSQQVAMTPQFILAAGQPIQGIQGAQLLIPTSSGVAIQQLITIPVSQYAGNQLVQMIATNGQIFTTTLANLQSLSQPYQIPGISPANSAGASNLQPQSMITAGNLTNPIPQLLTNASGQVVAIGPQVFTQPVIPPNQSTANLIQMAPQLAAQLQQQQLIQQQQLLSVQEEKQVSPQNSNQPIALVSKSQPSAITITPSTQALGNQQPTSQLSLNQVAMVTAHLAAQAKHSSSVQTMAQHLSPTQDTPLTHASQETVRGGIPSPVDGTPTIATLQATNTINNQTSNIVDGINLEEIKEFAKAFKIRRLSLGLTQTQVGQALSATEGPSYSQSAICRFEKLDITPKSAQKIKPVLERWMKEAEERYKNGDHNLTEFIGSEPSKKRKRRTSFTPAALEILNQFFEKNTHPSGAEMTELAEQLNYEREVVRVWFCNRRQALKNTIKKLKGGT